MRVVSLLPAATEIVSALGLGDALVGRSQECDYPEAVLALPALTRPRIDASRTRAEAEPLLGVLRSLAGRVLLLDGNAYLNRPGPRLVEAVELLAGWLRRRPLAADQGLAVEPAVAG
jgi:ABC-type hemin transport system substrate-binding protein